MPAPATPAVSPPPAAAPASAPPAANPSAAIPAAAFLRPSLPGHPPACPPTARLLPAILAMAVIVTASNILVQYRLGAWLTWGALSYPFAFLVTDLTNRFHGPVAARRVVLAGFAIGVLCSLIGAQIEGEFGPLVTLRAAVGSGTAFLVAQLVDVAVFNRLRRRSWWRAPFVSTLIASSLDTAIFFTIAFSARLTFFGEAETLAAAWAAEPVALLGLGPVLPLWVSLAVADWSAKITMDFVALVPFRLAIAHRRAPIV